jgi:hypothetical protein
VKKKCSIEGCEKPNLARTWCRTHYTRWYETGSTELGVRNPPSPPPRQEPTPLIERFEAKVVKKSDGCWLWTGGKTKQGYGYIYDHAEGRNVQAHRVSWELANGTKIPKGLVIDHLCRTPRCVNPDHLEPVTYSVNAIRGVGADVARRRAMAVTHCPQGHPYSPENTYYYNEGRTRVCRTCAIERTQERRRRMKQAD